MSETPRTGYTAAMASPPLPRLIRLQAVDPARNIARAYSLHMGVDLFGAWTVETSWGRVGTAGQSRRYSFADRSVAHQFVKRILGHRQTARSRIGVGYRLLR
jgi:predicted DNA-binding WGR domain protein